MCNAFCFKKQLSMSINSKVLYKYTCDTCNSVYIVFTLQQFESTAINISIIVLSTNPTSRECCKQFSFTVKRVFIDSENEAIFKHYQRINAIIPF